MMDSDNREDPINNPVGSGLEIGFHRPGFRHDAPKWFTLLVFGFFIGLILAGLLLR